MYVCYESLIVAFQNHELFLPAFSHSSYKMNKNRTGMEFRYDVCYNPFRRHKFCAVMR